MKKFNQSLLELHLKFIAVNGEFMDLSVTHDGKETTVVPEENKIIQINITFPTEVILTTSNKNMDKDTLIDENGKILLDKHIVLTKLIVDRIKVPDFCLVQLPVSSSGARTSYLGFNDQFRLRFMEKNSFYWSLATKSNS
jgi:hypothetical protein